MANNTDDETTLSAPNSNLYLALAAAFAYDGVTHVVVVTDGVPELRAHSSGSRTPLYDGDTATVSGLRSEILAGARVWVGDGPVQIYPVLVGGTEDDALFCAALAACSGAGAAIGLAVPAQHGSPLSPSRSSIESAPSQEPAASLLSPFDNLVYKYDVAAAGGFGRIGAAGPGDVAPHDTMDLADAPVSSSFARSSAVSLANVPQVCGCCIELGVGGFFFFFVALPWHFFLFFFILVGNTNLFHPLP